jgi:Family of unknown function (DUF6088)
VKKEEAMSAISCIRKFIYNLPEGETFTTRDCLAYGPRSAIDAALSRLVAKGLIRRLARGVFARDPDCCRSYSDYEIAKLKAEAFGRKLVRDACDIAVELGIEENSKQESTFSIDGPTTRFRVGDRTIHLKRIAERKMRMYASKAGQTICALWHLGKHEVTPAVIEQATRRFNRLDRIDLRTNIRWMPAWLSGSFKSIYGWQPVHATSLTSNQRFAGVS